MTISAVRPVRSTDRLIDAPTVGIQIPQQVTAPALSPLGIGRRAYGLVLAGDARSLPEVVNALGVSVEQVRDGIRAFLQHETGIDPGTPLAAGLLCPSWCSRDEATHRAEKVDEWGPLGTIHERIVTESTADDPAYINEPATVRVLVEQCDELSCSTHSSGSAGDAVDGARVVLAITRGAEARFPGEEKCQGWSGTVEQIEHLGNALLSAARMARGLPPTGEPLRSYRADIYGTGDRPVRVEHFAAATDEEAETLTRQLVISTGAQWAALFVERSALVYVDTVRP